MAGEHGKAHGGTLRGVGIAAHEGEKVGGGVEAAGGEDGLSARRIEREAGHGLALGGVHARQRPELAVQEVVERVVFRPVSGRFEVAFAGGEGAKFVRRAAGGVEAADARDVAIAPPLAGDAEQFPIAVGREQGVLAGQLVRVVEGDGAVGQVGDGVKFVAALVIALAGEEVARGAEAVRLGEVSIVRAAEDEVFPVKGADLCAGGRGSVRKVERVEGNAVDGGLPDGLAVFLVDGLLGLRGEQAEAAAVRDDGDGVQRAGRFRAVCFLCHARQGKLVARRFGAFALEGVDRVVGEGVERIAGGGDVLDVAGKAVRAVAQQHGVRRSGVSRRYTGKEKRKNEQQGKSPFHPSSLLRRYSVSPPSVSGAAASWLSRV